MSIVLGPPHRSCITRAEVSVRAELLKNGSSGISPQLGYDVPCHGIEVLAQGVYLLRQVQHRTCEGNLSSNHGFFRWT
eukprot:12907070-Alexandrium_andersonii.AAC.1